MGSVLILCGPSSVSQKNLREPSARAYNTALRATRAGRGWKRAMSIPRIRLISGYVLLMTFSTIAACSSTASPQSETNPHSTPSLELPLTFERHVGDLDAMVKRREIRVLVVPSRSGFFYDH